MSESKKKLAEIRLKHKELADEEADLIEKIAMEEWSPDPATLRALFEDGELSTSLLGNGLGATHTWKHFNFDCVYHESSYDEGAEAFEVVISCSGPNGEVTYWKTFGWYNSYEGTEWEYEFTQAYPRTETIVVYKDSP